VGRELALAELSWEETLDNGAAGAEAVGYYFGVSCGGFVSATEISFQDAVERETSAEFRCIGLL
jgi:hypothetical protein